MSRHLALIPCLLLATTCQLADTPCARDSDCGTGVCVTDLDRGDSYCSRTCDSDADCPEARFCDVRITGATGEEDVLALCIERVRECDAKEACNGLDDDCDGEVDERCEQLRCHDDPSCGGIWPCAPKRDAPNSELLCQEPRSGAAAPGEPCSEGGDCYNDLCEIGVCAPVCHFDDECPDAQRCAAASTTGTAVRHGTCHIACDAYTACPQGTTCVLRGDLYSCYWRAVCSPTRGSLGMGAPCDAHDACESALCMRGRCTRPCATAYDCAGLGATCDLVTLSPDPMACAPSGVLVCLW